ncbi:MAG: YebC/PmpR family DNA-binding transcriptional regulator, partial [Rikenellaceae bacterium]
KMKRWSNMARVFTRLGKQICMAAKSGGPDPENNPTLRALIHNAKAANMPKDNIERAIKRAVSKDVADYKEVVFEGYAPFGIAVVVETATDNNTRTVANVRSYFNKAGGSLGTSGCLDFMFDRKCVFKIANPGDLDLEELELDMIDYGCDEIFAEDEEIVIYGAFESYGAIQKHLEENNYQIISGEFERIPTDFKDVDDEQRATIEKLVEKFESDEDVTNVFTNMK